MTATRWGARSAGILILMIGFLTIVSVPAQAGEIISFSGGSLRYDALAGEVNRVTVTDTANQIFIKDTAGISGGINDLPACRYTVPAQTEVACRYPSPGFRRADRVLRIALGDGNDTLNIDTSGPNAGWRQATASDGPGKDLMVGWQGPDRFVAGPGNDRYYLRGGNDQLLAGVPVPGVPGIPSGSGNDTAYGGPGNDNLRGGAGIDLLIGGPGFDILDGRPGERRRG